MKRNASLLALITAIVFVGATGSRVYAQVPQQGAYAGPNLDKNQQAKALARKKQAFNEFKAVSDNKKLSQQQKQAKFIEIQKRFETDMLAILTPAQRADYLKRKAEADKKYAEIMRLSNKIRSSMTPDQQKKIKAIQDNGRKEAMAIIQNKSLKDAEKQAKILNIEKGAEGKILAIMTPAQKADFLKLQELYPAPQMHH